jgi:hypothetical protein
MRPGGRPNGASILVSRQQLGRWVTYADAERAWEEVREIDEETAAGVMAEEDGVSREAARTLLHRPRVDVK